MPRKYYKKKNYKKKKYNYRKPYNKFQLKPVSYTINKDVGIPDRMFTKLCITAFQQDSTGTYNEFVYCINSLYDPYRSYFGTQPMFYDQYSALYQVYKVLGVYVNFQFSRAAASDPVRIVMYANTASGVATNMEEARQRKGARYGILDSNASQKDLKGFSKYISIRKLFGENLDDTTYEANVTSNPTTQAYLHIGVMNGDNDGSAIALRLHSYFKFYCTFYDRQNQNES